MSLDLEACRLEEMQWQPTGGLRWFRPPGADDTEKVLQQLYERNTGERQWRTVTTCLAA